MSGIVIDRPGQGFMQVSLKQELAGKDKSPQQMPIREIEVTDVGTLLAAARQLLGGFRKTQHFFRGHAVSDWQLVPSVHRHYDIIGERSLAGRFRLSAPSRHSNCPELTNLASWIALMQHFGLPTRLLDWTGSLLTAAYFAVSHEPKPGPGAIWALVPSELNKASRHGKDVTFLLHGDEARPMLAAAFGEAPCEDDVLAVLPVDIDMRMTVQSGVFTLHATAEPLEKRKGVEQYLAKFVIPKEAKARFDDELWVLGARRAVLFPDLDNLAQDLASDNRLIARRRSS